MSFSDCGILLYLLRAGKFTILEKSTFSVEYNDDVYLFTSDASRLINQDKVIAAIHQLDSAPHKIAGLERFGITNYKLVQTQVVENYHCPDEQILNFLNDGNIILSSASVRFTHPNFILEPYFNLVFFYNELGFNYFKYHRQTKKPNLMGTYYREKHVDGHSRYGRTKIFSAAKKQLGDDLVVYSDSPKTSFDRVVESNATFGKWTQHTHITSYTDYAINACNLMFETLDPFFIDTTEDGLMYKREYITEKTLKAILFSEEYLFFILFSTDYIFKTLTDLGFWFLNSEFYDGDIEQSVMDAINYVGDLKTKLEDNQLVYEHLLELHKDKLENNIKVFHRLHSHYDKADQVLALIKR